MIEQLSLFQDTNPLQEIADEFIKQVNEICSKFKTTYKKAEIDYSVWKHVKNLGERLSVNITFEDCELHEPDKWYGGIGRDNLIIDEKKLNELGDKFGVNISVYAEWETMHLYTIYKKYAKSKKSV